MTKLIKILMMVLKKNFYFAKEEVDELAAKILIS